MQRKIKDTYDFACYVSHTQGKTKGKVAEKGEEMDKEKKENNMFIRFRTPYVKTQVKGKRKAKGRQS